jgi:hypothetical protein
LINTFISYTCPTKLLEMYFTNIIFLIFFMISTFLFYYLIYLKYIINKILRYSIFIILCWTLSTCLFAIKAHLTVNLCKILNCNFVFFIRSFYYFINKSQSPIFWRPSMIITIFTSKFNINFICFLFIFIWFIFKIKIIIFFSFFLKIILSW